MNDVPIDVKIQGVRAWANGNLEHFLKDYDEETSNYLRRVSTPGNAFVTNRTIAVVADKDGITKQNDIMQNSWLEHKEWISNGPHKLPKSGVESIKNTTNDIKNIILNSNKKKLYGLVVGHVQSGKTANYTALLSRIADIDYTIVIVLSGILNDLRHQTQHRLLRDLTGDRYNPPWLNEDEEAIDHSKTQKWTWITSLHDDIGKNVSNEMADLLESSLDKKEILIGVVKKNVNVLEHLLDGIMSADPEILSKHKLLIIDDEADHATVNTGGDSSEGFEDDIFDFEEVDEVDSETDPSRTNRAVRKIIHKFIKSTYIGYTATPFANVLIDKDQEDNKYGKSLYPRDFILSLPTPKNYFGPSTFFGKKEGDERYVTTIHPEEVTAAFKMQEDEKTSRNEAVPKSLQNAMMDYLLSGIVKKIRKQNGITINKHHTMLIHIQWRNDNQKIAANLVNNLWDDWMELASITFSGGEKFRKRLKDRWENEFKIWDTSLETWSQIEEELLIDSDDDSWMSGVEIKMINSLTDDKLDYALHKKGLNVIAIGGNKLSRGLTLEGLTISYFLRSTKMYDSLMQMGRWFGYRNGYEDLIRVHTSLELLSWFEWLVTVEESVRGEIARYEILGLTPEELAVRIPMHPKMKITSSSKMKSAVREIINYQGTTAQTTRLPVESKDILELNLTHTTKFLQKLGQGEKIGRMWAWKSVTVSMVSEYLEELDLMGPPDTVFDAKGIARYLRREYRDEKIFIGQPGIEILDLENGLKTVPDKDPRWGFGSRYISRSQGCVLLDDKYIGTNNIQLIGDSERKDMDDAMKENDGVNILIYLIAPGSKPKKGSTKRIALPNFEIPIVGLIIKFPATEIENEIMEYAKVRGIPSNV